MKTEEIQARLERGYTMAIYGTRENIHEQMTNDIKELLEAINYTRCCKSDSELLSKRPNTSSTWECFSKSEKQQKGNV